MKTKVAWWVGNSSFISDKNYTRIRFFLRFRKFLNLKNPRTFSEKIQYIKLFDRNEFYRNFIDKVKVREFINEQIGPKYLTKIYYIYNNFSSINFNDLPEKFVLKANHGSGLNYICKDKDKIDKKELSRIVNHWLNIDFYNIQREWAYKGIERKLICEEYLESEYDSLIDYKFFCFNSKPKFIQVDFDRFTNHTRNIYDLEWKKLPVRLRHKNISIKLKRPDNLTEMIEIAKKLSRKFRLVRIDLYSVYRKTYFGEMTFYPGSGFEKFIPDKWDLIFGDELAL
jgi:hypothetical protein